MADSVDEKRHIAASDVVQVHHTHDAGKDVYASALRCGGWICAFKDHARGAQEKITCMRCLPGKEPLPTLITLDGRWYADLKTRHDIIKVGLPR